MNKEKMKLNKNYRLKKIEDSDGITYEEVDYETYLASGNKHRIIQSLNSRYFVECDSPLKSK